MSMQVEAVEQAVSEGAGTRVAIAVEEGEQKPPLSAPTVDRQLVASLVEGARSQGLSVDGEGGLLAELTRLVLELRVGGRDHRPSRLRQARAWRFGGGQRP